MHPIDAELVRQSFPQLEDVGDLAVSRSSRDGTFRLVGHRGDKTVVVEAFPVGSTYEGQYRGWARITEPYRRAMQTRPESFEHHVLMVGLYADDDWRWMCLWPESLLLQCDREGLLEGKRNGTLWRVNPGYLPKSERPAVVGNAEREPTIWDAPAPEPAATTLPLMVSYLERIEADLPVLPVIEQQKVDEYMLRIRQGTRRRLRASGVR